MFSNKGLKGCALGFAFSWQSCCTQLCRQLREDVFIFNAVTFDGYLGEGFLNSKKGLGVQKIEKNTHWKG